MKLIVFVFILSIGKAKSEVDSSEENLPTLCHVCKHTVTEFLEELKHSGKSRDVLQLGHVLQSGRHKTIVYHKSGLRLIEALENTCKKIEDYKVHKDKPNHLRYAKDESATFITLKNLKKRGVKVDLGFPDEMWDTPDAEIVALKRQCENILEKHEEYLNDWYFNHQENNLFDWFCKDHVLKQKDHACLKGTGNLEERKSKEMKTKERVDDDDDGGDDDGDDDDGDDNDDDNDDDDDDGDDNDGDDNDDDNDDGDDDDDDNDDDGDDDDNDDGDDNDDNDDDIDDDIDNGNIDYDDDNGYKKLNKQKRIEKKWKKQMKNDDALEKDVGNNKEWKQEEKKDGEKEKKRSNKKKLNKEKKKKKSSKNHKKELSNHMENTKSHSEL